MKARVTFPHVVWVTVTVDLDDTGDADENRERAIEVAADDAVLSSYVGNGGMDKLVGVYGENVSVDPDDCALDPGMWNVPEPDVEFAEEGSDD